MYVPKEFSVPEQREIDTFIESHPFVTLTTVDENGFPIATHLPVIAKKQDNIWILEGHIALANLQAQHLQANTKALAVLLGPDAYVSSSVYGHKNVPTWNYQAVHLSGKISPLNETELDLHLNELVDFFEKNRENPLQYKEFSSDMMYSYKKEIIGFRLQVSHIEAAFKLSQNRNEADHKAIISDLEQCPFSGAKAVAEAMKKHH